MEHVQVEEANKALDIAHKISRILDTGLDKHTLSILIALCESGVNPEVRLPSQWYTLNHIQLPPDTTDALVCRLLLL